MYIYIHIYCFTNVVNERLLIIRSCVLQVTWMTKSCHRGGTPENLKGVTRWRAVRPPVVSLRFTGAVRWDKYQIKIKQKNTLYRSQVRFIGDDVFSCPVKFVNYLYRKIFGHFFEIIRQPKVDVKNSKVQLLRDSISTWRMVQQKCTTSANNLYANRKGNVRMESVNRFGISFEFSKAIPIQTAFFFSHF